MTVETNKSVAKWVEEQGQNCKTRATAGEHFIYEYLPSAIIECQTAKCMCCGEEFTDYVE